MGRFGWRTLLRNRTALTGTVITFVLLAVVIGAELMPYSAVDMDFINILAPPSLEHPFGTNSFGRDVLTRVLFGGAPPSSSVAPASRSAARSAYVDWLAGGVVWGSRHGAHAHRRPPLRLPEFVLALFLMVVLGFGVPNVVIAIALVYFPLFARLTRNTALLVKEEPYIQAARLMPADAPHPVPRNPAEHRCADLGAGERRRGLRRRDRSRAELPRPRRAAADASLGVIMADGERIFSARPVGANPVRALHLDRALGPQPAGRRDPRPH